jgi:hypothetical protein
MPREGHFVTDPLPIVATDLFPTVATDLFSTVATDLRSVEFLGHRPEVYAT